MVTGVECLGPFDHVHCVACLIGKAPQQPYAHNGNRALGIGDLLHMDICGPYPVTTPPGMKYFYIYSTIVPILGLPLSSISVLEPLSFMLLLRHMYVEHTTGRSVCVVCPDGALEFTAGAMGYHFQSKGISVQVTAPYAHSQNSKAERYVRTLKDGGRCLLLIAGCLLLFGAMLC